MRPTSYRVMILGLLVLGAGSICQGLDSPGYVQRLRMPAAQDLFARPRAVAADLHTGEIFVCDTGNNRIVIFDRDGGLRYRIQGGDTFRSPVDIAVNAEGYIYVLARREGDRRILRLDFDGLFIEEIPLSLPSDVPPSNLVSIALDPSGQRLYALDQGAMRLWLADRGGGILGSVDLASDLNEEDALELLLGHVDVYGDTVLVAVPTAGVARLFDLEGRPRGQVGRKGSGPRQTGFPVAAALGADGNVLVLDKQRMMLTSWRPEGNQFLGEFLGIGRSPGALYNPEDLALDGRGRIYISQGFEGRVQAYQGLAPAAGVRSADEAGSQ